MNDPSDQLILSPCMHKHVVLERTGGMKFTAGEVHDDIQDHLRCLDCLEYLDDEEVREAWMGDIFFIDPAWEEKDCGDR